jgi:hypothetical protein
MTLMMKALIKMKSIRVKEIKKDESDDDGDSAEFRYR